MRQAVIMLPWMQRRLIPVMALPPSSFNEILLMLSVWLTEVKLMQINYIWHSHDIDKQEELRSGYFYESSTFAGSFNGFK